MTDTWKYSFVISFITTFVYMALWNSIHPDMHGVNLKLDIEKGPPRLLQMSPGGGLYKWLWKNHAIHHLQKGDKKNFNIVIPGMDHLLGTYQYLCYDNTEYCKENSDIVRICGEGKPQSKCLSDDDVLPNDK